jgi:hypothetical protein
MFTLNFVVKPTSEREYEVIRTLYQRNVELAHNLGWTPRARLFTDDFLSSSSSRVQSMIGELATMGLR